MMDTGKQREPIVAKSPWYIKLFTIPTVGIYLAGFWPPPVWFNLWASANWIFRACIIFSMIGIPLSALSVFVKRNVFHEQGIEHISAIGIKSFKPYSNIELMKYYGNFLRIIFSDGSKITIGSANANLNEILSIIKQNSAKVIPIKYI